MINIQLSSEELEMILDGLAPYKDSYPHRKLYNKIDAVLDDELEPRE